MSTLEKKMMRAIFGLVLLASCSVHAQSTYIWANSNITPTPTASLNWFNTTQGAWTGGTPVSGNLNTIQFFDNTTTSLTHTGNPSTQTSVIDTVGDVAFELGTLTLSGLASAINNAKLNLTISGDAMNFSAATGTINLDARNVDGDQLITYNLNSNIQLGTASSAGALTITGSGSSAFNIGGIISELQVGGGSLIKSGSSTVSLTGANSYTGTTTLNGGTLVLSGANGSIVSSTGIALNGGNLTLTNADNATEDDLDRVKNDAVITSNGGTITYTTTTASSARNFIETLGSVALISGQLDIFNTLDKSAGSQTLALSGLTLTGATNTSAITFSNTGGLNITIDRIRVNGITADTAGDQIIGPWATVGTAANAQTDYAIYDSDTVNGYVVARNIATSAQSTWSTDYTTGTGSLNNTMGAAGTPGQTLGGARYINTLRHGAAGAATPNSTTEYFTLAGNTFSNGDIVGASGTTGLTAGAPYYVIDKDGAGAGTFRLSTSPGGAAVGLTGTTAGQIAGAFSVGAFNLGTYGILNGTAAPLIINGGGGAITLPTATSGNLVITPGAGAITINAPINDNGAGILTLVKNGSNTLTLNGNNSFNGDVIVNTGVFNPTGTNTFVNITVNNGGTLISGGTGVGPGTLGAAGGTITFNGTTTFNPQRSNTGAYDKNVVVNGTTTFSMSSQYYDETFTGVLSGSGTIINNNSNGDLTFSNSGNTFTGAIRLDANGNSNGLTVHSLADSANPITFNGANATLTFSGAAATSTSLLFNSRQMVLATSGRISNFNSDASKTITITTNLGFSGTGTRTLTLDGSNTGVNIFAGNITDNGASAVSLTKSDTGTWILSGTNTYSGKTTVGAGWTGPGTLIFQGKQAVSPNTTFETQQSSGATAKLVFLDDSAGLISLNNSWTFRSDGGPGTKNTHIFVGNNSTANGGNNPGSTQTGSTIALGGYTSFPNGGVNGNAIDKINITGANGYKLQLASIAFPDISAKPAATSYTISLNPTTAPVIVAGGVTPFASGNLNSTPVLNLDGTATGNEIQGAIADPSNVGTSNPLSLTKNNSSTWTLSGANTFTGTTTVNGGTLVLAVGTCLSDTNLLSIASGAKVKLNSGVKEGVGLLKTNGVTAVSGTYGSTASTATYKNNTYFDESEAGVLYVGVEIPKSGTFIQFF